MQGGGQASAPFSSCSSSFLGLDSSNVAGVDGVSERGNGWSSSIAKRAMYTDVVAARVGKRPSGIPESQVHSATSSPDFLSTFSALQEALFLYLDCFVG